MHISCITNLPKRAMPSRPHYLLAFRLEPLLLHPMVHAGHIALILDCYLCYDYHHYYYHDHH